MEKQWVEENIAKLKKTADVLYKNLISELDWLGHKYPEFVKSINRAKERLEIGSYDTFEVCISLISSKLRRVGIDFRLIYSDQYIQTIHKINYIKSLEDSKRIKLYGDIIITDPCYILKKVPDGFERPDQPEYQMFGIGYDEFWRYYYMQETNEKIKAYEDAKEEWIQKYGTDQEKSDGGYHLEKLGFTKFLCRDTLYGDWSCHAFSGDGEVLGQFGADSGMVCVCLLDEVLSYNPDFDGSLVNTGMATVIKGFNGNVTIKVRKEILSCRDYFVTVEGEGNINFYTRQTGL